MMIALHKNARTTPATRAEMAASSETAATLALRYGVSEGTVYKWKGRDSFHDASHTPKRLQTTLTPAQEHIVGELRKTLLLPLDDLLAVTREFLCPQATRSGLDRCLRRHGVGNLHALKRKEPEQPHKAFKSYEPGFIHIDVKYLPQMPDETSRRYLFVAIDRATRWVFVQIKSHKTAAAARSFVNALHKACPIKMQKILTDNGKEFTDRLFARRERQATGNHEFDQLCQALNIEHRLTKPRTPRTNGMVERFNGRIADVLKTHRFTSGEDLEQTLTIESVLSPKTKAVICVHLAGWPCDMDPIMALAESRGIKVIEDCAQAHGARYKGRAVGSIGHVGAWSFCQDKIMTTGGEGGMVTTNDSALWRAMWSFKDHGKSYAAVYERQHPPGFRWVHESFGTNWRMLEMQAVIGRIQLRRMAQWSAARKQNAQAIWSACAEFAALRVPGLGCNGCEGGGSRVKPGVTSGSLQCARQGRQGCEHAHYKCYVYVQADHLAAGWTRDKIIKAISEQGVPCYEGSCSEVYLEKAFDGTGWRPAIRLPVAKALGESSIMFLVHPTLTQAEVNKTCDVIRHVMVQASA